MASYIYEMVCEPVSLRTITSAWDMSDYEDIEDFKSTNDFSFAKRGQCQFAL